MQLLVCFPSRSFHAKRLRRDRSFHASRASRASVLLLLKKHGLQELTSPSMDLRLKHGFSGNVINVPGCPRITNLSVQLSPERCQRVELSRQVAHAATLPMPVCRQSKSSFTPKSMQHANQATKQMGSGSNFALYKCRSVLTALLFTICSCSSLREGLSPP